MVVEVARYALSKAERNDHPDVIQVKGRFNRAVLETPAAVTCRQRRDVARPRAAYRSRGETLIAAAGGETVLARTILPPQWVSSDLFWNVYVFGIDPKHGTPGEQVLARSRSLFSDTTTGPSPSLTKAPARAPWRRSRRDVSRSQSADGKDLSLMVVGALDGFELRDPPPRTVDTPALAPDLSFVWSGVRHAAHQRGDLWPPDPDRCSCCRPNVGGRSVRRRPAPWKRLRLELVIASLPSCLSQFRRNMRFCADPRSLHPRLPATTIWRDHSSPISWVSISTRIGDAGYATPFRTRLLSSAGALPGLGFGRRWSSQEQSPQLHGDFLRPGRVSLCLR